MRQFWWLLSFIISVAGFAVVGAQSFFNGEDILLVALKSIGAFLALWIVQSFLRALMALGASTHTEAGQTKET